MTLPRSLATRRLRLRPFDEADWSALHALYADPQCTRFTFRRVLSEGESWRAMASMVGHWTLRGYGPYALVEAASGGVIGTVGLWYPNDWPEPEIKWALARQAWGQGYASEAVRALQPLACAHFGRPPISFIDAGNGASIRLALAVGALLEREVEFRGSTWHVYRHPASPAAAGRDLAPP